MLEALGPGGLLLVRDTAESEGRSLLRALVSEAAARAEQVLVVLLEVTQEEFQRGLSPSVRERLHFRDLSGDPLGWLSRGGLPSPPRPPPTPHSPPPPRFWGVSPPPTPPPPLPRSWGVSPPPTPHSPPPPRFLGGSWGVSPPPPPLPGGLPSPPRPSPLPGGLPSPPRPSPPPVLVLDSLSWALLREPLPHPGLGALLGEGHEPPPRILALLHQDLHPPPLLGALGALAQLQLILGGPPKTPGAPRSLRLLRDPRKGGGALEETLTLLPDGSLGGPPPPDPSPNLGEEEEEEEPKKTQNAPNLGPSPLTFRLGLSGAERGARASLTPPYLPRIVPEPPPEDPEDPDEDLDL